MTARLLVTGSRSWTDETLLLYALRLAGERLGRDTVLVHGDARGADRAAADIWARWHLPTEAHPADWDGPCVDTCRPGHRVRRKHGGTYCPTAGTRRNSLMVTLGADLCLAAPVGKATGTRDCMTKALYAGIETVTVADLVEKGWAA